MKIYINIRKLTAFLMIILFGSACTKNFEEINTDPVLITKDIIQPSMLFTAVLKNSIFSTYNNNVFKEYCGYYSNQASGNIFQDQDWSGPFAYGGNLINIAEVIRLTAANPKLVNQNAMARIWKVWLFQQLTDAYGDVPYFEALLPVEGVVNQPKYDTQKAIYTDMLKELKEAVAQLNTDPALTSFGNADLLYSGNVDKWKRLGNSLRLRLATRIRFADVGLAKQHITEVITAPLIDNNTLNAKLITINGTDVNNRNPLYNSDVSGNYYPMWVSFTVTQELLKRNDPRLTIYANPAKDGVAGYRGRPIALQGAEKLRYGDNATATLPSFFRDAVYPIMVMNAAEVYFLRAESALAGMSSENAEVMYRNGITASLAQYGVSASASAAYLGSPAATLAGTTEGNLEDIIVQKWLAMYHQSTEAWAEFRRTGYPKIWTGGEKGSTDGNIPRRLTYPVSEYSRNQANVTEAASRFSGGDKMMSRIWWDAKTGLPFLHAKQGMFPPEIY